MEKRNAYDVLKERGFIEQMTHEDEIRELFSKDEPVTFYIGFDPTADSLHVGHFLTVMAMAHMQRCGHRPDNSTGISGCVYAYGRCLGCRKGICKQYIVY